MAKHNLRCDICGRFLSYADLESYAASFQMIGYSYNGIEVYRGLCPIHNNN